MLVGEVHEKRVQESSTLSSMRSWDILHQMGKDY